MSSRGVNRAIIIGSLGVEPDVRYLPSGGQVTNIRVATSEQWKDKATGENRENTEWHRIVFFGKLAEIAGEYLRKGSQVYIDGKIKTRKWQGQDGQDRYTTEIVANDMQMLGGRPGGAGQSGLQSGYGQQPPSQQSQQAAGGMAPPPAQAHQGQGGGEGGFGDDEIPFRERDGRTS